MIRSLSRAAKLALCAATVLAPAVASATSYTFDFTNKGTSNGTASQTFSANSGALTVDVTGWHALDNSTAVTTDKIAKSSIGYWQGAGLGVLYGTDNGYDGTHQIDNVGGGSDFVVLRFSNAVTLSTIDRNVYGITGVYPSDSDLSFWADSNDTLGLSSSTTNAQLASKTVDESKFTLLSGGSTASKNVSFNSTASSKVWVIAAAFNQNNDGFKIANLVANTAPAGAVPEPASWAMMIVGFGAVGGSLRIRRRSVAFA